MLEAFCLSSNLNTTSFHSSTSKQILYPKKQRDKYVYIKKNELASQSVHLQEGRLTRERLFQFMFLCRAWANISWQKFRAKTDCPPVNWLWMKKVC